MYFWFFKLKKWGKKTVETRRRNCAVMPYLKIKMQPHVKPCGLSASAWCPVSEIVLFIIAAASCTSIPRERKWLTA